MAAERHNAESQSPSAGIGSSVGISDHSESNSAWDNTNKRLAEYDQEKSGPTTEIGKNTGEAVKEEVAVQGDVRKRDEELLGVEPEEPKISCWSKTCHLDYVSYDGNLHDCTRWPNYLFVCLPPHIRQSGN